LTATRPHNAAPGKIFALPSRFAVQNTAELAEILGQHGIELES